MKDTRNLIVLVAIVVITLKVISAGKRDAFAIMEHQWHQVAVQVRELRGVEHATSITNFHLTVAYGSTLAVVQMALQNQALVSVMEVKIADRVDQDINVQGINVDRTVFANMVPRYHQVLVLLGMQTNAKAVLIIIDWWEVNVNGNTNAHASMGPQRGEVIAMVARTATHADQDTFD